MGTAQLRGLAGVLDGRRYRRHHRARPPSASPALRRRWQRRVLHIARARRSRFHRCRTEGAADGRDLFFDEHHFSVDQSYFRATAALISVSRPKPPHPPGSSQYPLTPNSFTHCLIARALRSNLPLQLTGVSQHKAFCCVKSDSYRDAPSARDTLCRLVHQPGEVSMSRLATESIMGKRARSTWS